MYCYEYCVTYIIALWTCEGYRYNAKLITNKSLCIYICTTSKPQLKIESYADSKNVILIIVTEYGLNHQSLMCCRTTFKDKLYQY